MSRRNRLRKALRREAEKATAGKPERAYRGAVDKRGTGTGAIILDPACTLGVYKTLKRGVRDFGRYALSMAVNKEK